MRRIYITNTVKRIAGWYASILLGFYILFSVIVLIELHFILEDDIDSRLKHEVEHIIATFEVVDSSVILIHKRELNEPDLKFVTDNPYFLQVYDTKGLIFFESENIKLFPQILLGFPVNFDPYYFESVIVNNERLRSIYKQLVNQKDEVIGYIQLSVIQKSYNKVLSQIFIINLISLPLIIIVVIIVSIFLAKKSYHPINKIIELANTISATNLSERLDFEAEQNDELGKLKNTLNSLFSRLENQIKEISEFTDNASHQLMTPLTAIKSELDFILKKNHPVEEYKETCSILMQQTDRLISMVRTMLIMSKECSNCSNNNNVFNLSNLLNNEIREIYSNQNINYDIEKNIYVRGKSEYFSLVVQNLLNNAVKYSPDKSKISLKLESSNERIKLLVIDEGIGISDKEKIKIFNRFYRVEEKRINNTRGYGLGLSLVKSVTESMGGKVTVYDNKPQGSIFEIILPIIKFDQ